jgi:hypothetical protein
MLRTNSSYTEGHLSNLSENNYFIIFNVIERYKIINILLKEMFDSSIRLELVHPLNEQTTEYKDIFEQSVTWLFKEKQSNKRHFTHFVFDLVLEQTFIYCLR